MFPPNTLYTYSLHYSMAYGITSNHPPPVPRWRPPPILFSLAGALPVVDCSDGGDAGLEDAPPGTLLLLLSSSTFFVPDSSSPATAFFADILAAASAASAVAAAAVLSRTVLRCLSCSTKFRLLVAAAAFMASWNDFGPCHRVHMTHIDTVRARSLMNKKLLFSAAYFE